MMNNEKKEYSVEEVAALLKVHTNTVRGFATKGILPGTMKTKPAEDDVLGWNAEWTFTQEDLDELQKNLAKHAREKILSETGRFDEISEERTENMSDATRAVLEKVLTSRAREKVLDKAEPCDEGALPG